MVNKRNFRIALIGSRSLHDNSENFKDIELCHKVCYRLAELGVTFTSGLCSKGMDAIAQKAYSEVLGRGMAFQSQFEVYVYSQKYIHRSRLPNKHLAIALNSTDKREMAQIASRLHPNWDACDTYAREMHTRNVAQILGGQLDKPVNAVITWCEVDNYLQPIGGTATAIKLALEKGIPVFNLNTSDKKAVLNEIRKLLLRNKII